MIVVMTPLCVSHTSVIVQSWMLVSALPSVRTVVDAG